MTAPQARPVSVRLSDAACCLLESDRPELNAQRRIVVAGRVVTADAVAIAALRDDLAQWVNGCADSDNPGAAKRTATAAIRAIDRALARASVRR